MAMVNANFIDYDSHYYRMIGEWDITPEDAFKRFYNFLRDFKFIGTFHYYMNKDFGSYSQLYKQYFIERVNNYQGHCDMVNARRNRLYNKGATLYPWYDDLVLLFPFTYNNEDAYDRYGRISYGKLHYITELWRMYCSEQKITHSTIQIKEKEDETIADNPRCSWENILEGCGFTV